MKNKIKIFVDCHYVDNYYSGSSSYLIGLYNELVKYDRLEIHLAGRNLERLKKNFKSPKFKFITLRKKSIFNLIFFEFPTLLRKGNYNYAHFTYYSPVFKFCKYIISIHDIIFLDFPKYFSFSHILPRIFLFYQSSKMANILLTISEYSKERISKRFSINSSKITITPCGFNPDVKTKPKKIETFKKNYILYVSRIENRKNHISLLKAYKKLKLYETHSLVLVGTIDDKIFELNKLIEEINRNEKNVIHYSNIEYENLIYLYKNAQLFVYPSIAEGFGIPPIEAIFHDCKTISSNSTAMKEFSFLKNFSFSPTNNSELEKKIVEVLKMSKHDYPFSKMKKEILKKYNWELAAENLYKAISKDLNFE